MQTTYAVAETNHPVKEISRLLRLLRLLSEIFLLSLVDSDNIIPKNVSLLVVRAGGSDITRGEGSQNSRDIRYFVHITPVGLGV